MLRFKYLQLLKLCLVFKAKIKYMTKIIKYRLNYLYFTNIVTSWREKNPKQLQKTPTNPSPQKQQQTNKQTNKQKMKKNTEKTPHHQTPVYKSQFEIYMTPTNQIPPFIKYLGAFLNILSKSDIEQARETIGLFSKRNT